MSVPSISQPSSAPPGRQPAATPGRPPAARQPLSARPAAVEDLLALARRGLAEAAGVDTPAERYAAAHLAALRSGAAVLAARARPERNPTRRRGPRSVWDLVPAVLPQLAEWAAFFAAGAGKRAAAEARLPGAVTRRDADDLVRDAEAFLALITELLGRAYQPLLPICGGDPGPSAG